MDRRRRFGISKRNRERDYIDKFTESTLIPVGEYEIIDDDEKDPDAEQTKKSVIY